MNLTKYDLPEFVAAHGLPPPTPEYRFHPIRKWRFDWAWPDYKIALEYEGIMWRGRGRHQTAKGYSNDCEKYNAAAFLGWRVIRLTQKQFAPGDWIEDFRVLFDPPIEAELLP